MTHQNESRSRNPTFDATTLRHSQSTLGGDLPMIDICDDSAQSAPPNFTFDTDSLIREVESESRDTNQDLSGDLERILTMYYVIFVLRNRIKLRLRNHYVIVKNR